jgi:hypothetical protein
VTAPAFTQAELALRFRVRQSSLAHCRCGARVPAGAVACSRHGGVRVASTDREPGLTTRAYRTFAAAKRDDAATVGRAVHYKPKPCAQPGCETVFQPTGGRSRYCEAHR